MDIFLKLKRAYSIPNHSTIYSSDELATTAPFFKEVQGLTGYELMLQNEE